MNRLVAFVLGLNVAFALEFGSMGNTPASVGGAGVAYKKNSWALYYNPALLAVNRKFNIAYSFGVGYGENNLAQLANIDYDNIQNLPDTITNLAQGKSAISGMQIINATNGGVANNNARSKTDYSSLGLVADVLQQVSFSGGSGITDESSLKNYIDTITGQSGSDISDSISKLKNLSGDEKTNKLTTIKSDLLGAIGKVEANGSDVGILKSLIENIDVSKIDSLIENLKDSGSSGNIDFSKLLTAVGGIKIGRGANASIDRLLDDYVVIDNSINDNNLKIHSNNGLVFHYKGSKKRGAIGVGILTQIYGFMQLEMDKTHSKFIIKNNTSYYEVTINKNSISLSSSSADSYNNSSILSPQAQHNLHSNNLALVEIPIAYGHSIPFIAGDFHIGASLKYIYAMSVFNTQMLNFDNLKLNFDFKDNMRQTHTFGVDIGTLYTIEGFSLGLVGKNLNTPSIQTTNGKFKLNSQWRAGVGLELWRFTFLMDIDLRPNTTLEAGRKNQMFGGGVIFDAKWVDFRLGAMRDLMPNPYGTIITGGMNIAHFLDISVQSSLITQSIKGNKMPNYFDMRIGGRFLF